MVNFKKKARQANWRRMYIYMCSGGSLTIALNALKKKWPPDAMAAASNVYSYKKSQDAGGMYTNMFASRSPGLFGSSWNPFMKQ